MADFTVKTDAQIDHWIRNHENKGVVTVPLYVELLEESARRGEARSHLYVERSLDALRDAAIKGRCTSYGALAAASGVEWSKARHRMNGSGGHLDQMLDVCHARGLPLLTAICVNQSNVETGELEPSALAGFSVGCRRLGYKFTDAISFHHEQRDRCFDWGCSQAADQ